METGKKNIKLSKSAYNMRDIINENDWFIRPDKLYAFAVAVHLKKFKNGEDPPITNIEENR